MEWKPIFSSNSNHSDQSDQIRLIQDSMMNDSFSKNTNPSSNSEGTEPKTIDSRRDEVDEEEEEEFLIMADIGHDIDQQTVLEHACNSEIRAIDVDGNNPFIQIGPYTFQGQYNYVLGTNLFFSTTPTTTDDSSSITSRTDDAQTPSGTSHHDLNFIGLSDKKLNLSRVYIYPKKTDDPPSNS